MLDTTRYTAAALDGTLQQLKLSTFVQNHAAFAK